jgi:hypothetical protein
VASERLGKRIRLFEPTVLRRREGDRDVYLMHRQKRGWGEYAIPLRHEREVEVFYHVTVGEWTSDEHGEYAPVLLDGTAAA